MQWFENEQFWLNYGPVMFDSKRWAEAETVAESICAIAGLSKGNSVLDAGCGPGRISIELAAKGLDVTGVDIIQPYLDAAADSAKDEDVSLTLINSDLRTFNSERKFDAVINMYTSFGYCETIDEDLSILRNIFNVVKEGGWFIMECLSRENSVDSVFC
jgi:2-polyprenyl-3-methyl-5-hydroxy-6-metoxy-1,4-benzoquinol methylase